MIPGTIMYMNPDNMRNSFRRYNQYTRSYSGDNSRMATLKMFQDRALCNMLAVGSLVRLQLICAVSPGTQIVFRRADNRALNFATLVWTNISASNGITDWTNIGTKDMTAPGSFAPCYSWSTSPQVARPRVCKSAFESCCK